MHDLVIRRNLESRCGRLAGSELFAHRRLLSHRSNDPRGERELELGAVPHFHDLIRLRLLLRLLRRLRRLRSLRSLRILRRWSFRHLKRRKCVRFPLHFMAEEHALAEILHIQRRLRRLRLLRHSPGLNLRSRRRRLQRKNQGLFVYVIEVNRLTGSRIRNDGLIALIDMRFSVGRPEQFENSLFRVRRTRML